MPAREDHRECDPKPVTSPTTPTAVTRRSFVPELREPIFVEPEIVADREHGHPDLTLEITWGGKLVLEWKAVDRDRVGQRTGVVAALGQRDSLVEAEQIGILGVLVLDDDRDISERRCDLQ